MESQGPDDAQGAPIATGDPAAYVSQKDNSQHIVYRGADNHIHELRLTLGGEWLYNDLTQKAAAPTAAGDPTGYAWDQSGTQHVIYRGADDHIHELWRYELWLTLGDVWQYADLTQRAAAPAAAGDPAGYAWEGKGNQHVIYRGADNHIHELWYQQGSGNVWTHEDLTARAAAPPAAGNPSGFVWQKGNSQQIVYRDAAGHIHELRYK